MKRIALSFSVLLISILSQALLSSTAFAQDCGSQDADIFQSTRRARSIVSDYHQLHRRYHADRARKRALLERDTGNPLTWRADFAGLVNLKSTGEFDICTNLGSWKATADALSVADLTSLDLYHWGVGLEAFAISSDNGLTALENGVDQDHRSVASIRENDLFFGGRFTVHNWASLVAGWIYSKGLDRRLGNDGRDIDIGASTAQAAPRAYIGLASPLGDTTFHLLYEPEDVHSDLIELHVAALPLPGEINAVGVAGLKYIKDESQVIIELGLAEFREYFSINSEIELNPLRLRSLKARFEYMSGTYYPADFVEDAAATQALQKTQEPDTTWIFRPDFDVGAFAEVTYFNSRHLQAQTGQRDALGTNIGFSLRGDLTIFMMQMEFWTGINRPEELAQISDFAGHRQFGLRTTFRLGL